MLTENGIEEAGSHAELMKRGGVYARLYEMYTEKFDTAGDRGPADGTNRA